MCIILQEHIPRCAIGLFSEFTVQDDFVWARISSSAAYSESTPRAPFGMCSRHNYANVLNHL